MATKETNLENYYQIQYEIYKELCEIETRPMYTIDQILKINENARKYAGSFMKLLCEALLKSDQHNQQKLEKEFKKDFDRYLYL